MFINLWSLLLYFVPDDPCSNFAPGKNCVAFSLNVAFTDVEDVQVVMAAMHGISRHIKFCFPFFFLLFFALVHLRVASAREVAVFACVVDIWLGMAQS